MRTCTQAIQAVIAPVADRITPFAVRGTTKEKLRELTEECESYLVMLKALKKGQRLGCPLCKNSVNAVITGNGKGDTKKFECRDYHDPEVTGRTGTVFRFSTYTSHEAQEVYRYLLKESLKLLALCDGTIDGIALYLNISHHMVELAEEMLLDHLDQNGKGKPIVINDNLVVIYADFSSTRVSKNASIIMAKVGDAISYQVVCSMNHLTAWNFVKAVKERLQAKSDATVVFVTDGEKAWVDPIKSLFPEAVHIRQFHCPSARGMVYMHFPYEETRYTMRCLWDVVLEEGEASEKTKKMRQRRKLERSTSEKKDDDRTELSPDIFLWEGSVYEPRGTRRLIPSGERKGKKEETGVSGAGAMEGECEVRDLAVTHEDKGTEPACGEDMEQESSDTGPADERRVWRPKAPVTDGATLVFRGSLEDGLRIPAIGHAHKILVNVFGGRHITSNKVECLFSVKPGLRYHRTVKSGDAMIFVYLFLRTHLRKRSREEIDAFLEDVVSTERLQKIAIRGRTPFVNKAGTARPIVLEACEQGNQIVIRYCDARKRWTSRIIEPLGIETNTYTGMETLKAFCYLRGAERTFLLDRIVDAIPVDTSMAVVA